MPQHICPFTGSGVDSRGKESMLLLWGAQAVYLGAEGPCAWKQSLSSTLPQGEGRTSIKVVPETLMEFCLLDGVWVLPAGLWGYQ